MRRGKRTDKTERQAVCKAAQSQGARFANLRRIKASRKTQESSNDRNRKFHGGEIAVIAKSEATKKSRQEIQVRLLRVKPGKLIRRSTQTRIANSACCLEQRKVGGRARLTTHAQFGCFRIATALQSSSSVPNPKFAISAAPPERTSDSKGH